MAKKKQLKPLSPAEPPPPPQYAFGSIFPGIPPNPIQSPSYGLPPELVSAVRELETAIGLPVWLLLQDAPERRPSETSPFNAIDDTVTAAFFEARHGDLAKDQKIAILIDSNGGQARAAYELAMLLRRHCGGFVAVIPRHAKSAATLLALGAEKIIMNDHAELGPLDVQLYDPDREDWISGLDEVQSLERLQAFAMEAMDKSVLMLLDRTGKKVKTVMPFVTDFITKLTQPMFQGIDVVRYTQISRLLKVAQEYGERLLRSRYGPRGERIAQMLVEKYPEHGFPIYPDEAADLGLKLAENTPEISAALEKLTRELPNLTVVGRIV